MTKLKDFKNEIKVLDIAALLAKAKALKIEIDDLIMDKNMTKLKDLKSISKKRKELARVLTVLSQKEMILRLEVKIPKKSADAIHPSERGKAMADKEGGILK